MAGGITGAGNAMAAGQLGVGNTLASALQTGISSYQNQQNFNDYLASRRSGSAPQSGPLSMPGYEVNYYDGTYQGR
jgi:hypothetical protein